MINLDEIRKHMSQRDHWILLSDNQLKQVHLTLADDVPDLVAEVERLQKVVDATLEFVKYIPGSEKSSIAEDALIHAVNVYNNPILDTNLKRVERHQQCLECGGRGKIDIFVSGDRTSVRCSRCHQGADE